VNSRLKKFFPYYKPYLGLFYADMARAIIVSALTIAIPLCIRYITKNLEDYPPALLNQIYIMGGVTLGFVAIHTICHGFVDYKGHMMGALMEKDIRNELFAHWIGKLCPFIKSLAMSLSQ
jgi:ATP-binding cassette, subfamily B, bacterial